MSNSGINSIHVRPAARSDAAAISALARQLLIFEQSLEISMGELTPWASSHVEILKQMGRPDLKFMVAEVGGKPVGYIKVMIVGMKLSPAEIGLGRWITGFLDQSARSIFNLVLRRPRRSLDQTGGYIAGLYVHPQNRRSGIGSILVDAAEAWLREHDIQTCDLHVLSANQEARLFWEARGYHSLSVGLRKPL